jgi:hypothetical protein
MEKKMPRFYFEIVVGHAVKVFIFALFMVPFVLSFLVYLAPSLNWFNYSIAVFFIAIFEWVMVRYSAQNIARKYIILNPLNFGLHSTLGLSALVLSIMWLFAGLGGRALPPEYLVMFLTLVGVMYITTYKYLIKVQE